MRQIYLGLAIHNHQPLGNFPWVFEEAYQKAYLPMVQALEKHPAIRISLHYSGCLFDWLEEKHPEFLQRLADLVSQGQVEIMGGAYYEPILPAIPDADKLGQIRKMGEYIGQRFKATPTGLWLAERVWEPCLPKMLAEASMEWTLVDDFGFKSAGLDNNDLFGYYNTEEQGHFVKVFPISKQLRYSIPWHEVDSVIDYLRGVASDTESRIIVLGDDGEKFGIWPGTYDHCWENGWVDDFFIELESNTDWLHVIPLGDYAISFPPRGRVYLPCASYDEMMEWSLPADRSWEYTNLKEQLESEGRSDVTGFMRDGFWRNFLSKYLEINRMHKKMLRVHHKVYGAIAAGGEDCGLDELWKSQCNCPYWHGVFGGIYLADIRAATYANLVEAESKADKVINTKRSWIEFQETDFDGDGAGELLVDSGLSSIYLSPSEGGSIFEWDIRNHHFNVLSTLARRPEAYHHVLIDESSVLKTDNGVIRSIHDAVHLKDVIIPGSLVYDKYPRSSLIDHFFAPGTKFEDFAHGSYLELGDFASNPYQHSLYKRGNRMTVSLQRKGKLEIQGKHLPFEVTKQVKLTSGKAGIGIDYTLRNISNMSVTAVFASEWNINLLGGGHNEQAYYQVPGLTLEDSYLDSWGELEEIEKIMLGNRYLNIELEMVAAPRVGLWRFPVESISNSEGGIEKIYQASCFVILFPIKLPSHDDARISITWQSR